MGFFANIEKMENIAGGFGLFKESLKVDELYKKAEAAVEELEEEASDSAESGSARDLLEELEDALEYGDEVICQNLLTRYKEELDTAKEAYREKFSELERDERRAKGMLSHVYELIISTLEAKLSHYENLKNTTAESKGE